MKFSIITFLTTALLIASPCWAQEKDIDPFAKPSDSKSGPSIYQQVRIQVEYIELKHEIMNELMFGENASTNDADMRKQITKLIKDGKAKVIETQICTTLDGVKAESKSQEEFIYPTEYDPAEIFPNPVNEVGQLKPEAVDVKISAVGPNPTAFTSVYLGPSLTVEPNIQNNGKRVSLLLLSEIMEHTGANIWAEWKGHHGDSPVQMPTFYKLQVKTSLSLVVGKPLLAAALTPKDENGKSDSSRKLMVFVRADLTKISE